MQQISRRTLLAAGMGALSAGFLAACAPEKTSSAKNLTIGFIPITCAAPLLIADAQDLFAEAGLQVKLRKFAGWADLWTAYVTGEIDVAHMLSPMPIACDSGITNATRPTELLFTQNTNGQALTLATKHLQRVHTAQDLAGMVLGIPFEFSVHALLLRDFLVQQDLDPTHDLELRLLRPPDMIAQLNVGTIDGFIGPEPFNQRALQSGVGQIFIPTKQMWDGHPCCCIAASKDIEPSTRQALISALSIAAGVVNNADRADEVATVLAKEQYLNQKKAFIQQGLSGHYTDWHGQQHHDPDMIQFGGDVSATAITWMAAQLARWDLGSTQPLALEDAAVIAAANAVLPNGADTSVTPIEINGQRFDPLHPTAGYRA